MTEPHIIPLTVFVEGTRELDPSRVYLTYKDFPIPVRVDGVIVVLYRRLKIDVTGEDVSPQSTQKEVEAWAARKDVARRFEPAFMALQQQFQNDPDRLREARALKSVMKPHRL